jgi:hypothetical protein
VVTLAVDSVPLNESVPDDAELGGEYGIVVVDPSPV